MCQGDLVDYIKAHATAFRDAIERCDRAALGISFTHFPRGSCGDVVPLLGTYLKEVGAEAFQYVLGARGEGSSRETHAWLEGDRLINCDKYTIVDVQSMGQIIGLAREFEAANPDRESGVLRRLMTAGARELDGSLISLLRTR